MTVRAIAPEEIDACVMEIFTLYPMPIRIERIHGILVFAGALPDDRAARIYPQHPDRVAIVGSIDRLRASGRLAPFGLPPRDGQQGRVIA